MKGTQPALAIDPAIISSCVHCGFCLPVCPSYLATGHEGKSPRGRILIIDQLRQGKLAPGQCLAGELDSCLGCLGCVSACPSGVQYEKIISVVRPLLAEKRPLVVRFLERFAAEKILPNYPLLRLADTLLRIYQRSGLALLAGPVLLRLIPRLWQCQELLPPVPPHQPLPQQSWISGKKTGQVQLFTGCVMDIFYNQVNHAAIKLLTAQRHIVEVPEQTCCGALAAHAGDLDIARRLARQNIELFEARRGPIVVTGSGCTAMLKRYPELFQDDPAWRKRAADFALRIKDLSEFLSPEGFAFAATPQETRIAYHAACHLAHAQGITQEPLSLIQSVPGAHVVDWHGSTECCGSAGIFNITHAELSSAVLDRKIKNLAESGANMVLTTNPGCLLQLAYGLRKQQLPVPVVHLAEFLANTYCQEDG